MKGILGATLSFDTGWFRCLVALGQKLCTDFHSKWSQISVFQLLGRSCLSLSQVGPSWFMKALNLSDCFLHILQKMKAFNPCPKEMFDRLVLHHGWSDSRFAGDAKCDHEKSFLDTCAFELVSCLMLTGCDTGFFWELNRSWAFDCPVAHLWDRNQTLKDFWCAWGPSCNLCDMPKTMLRRFTSSGTF